MAAESLSDIKTDNRRYLIIRQASGNVSNLIPGENARREAGGRIPRSRVFCIVPIAGTEADMEMHWGFIVHVMHVGIKDVLLLKY